MRYIDRYRDINIYLYRYLSLYRYRDRYRKRLMYCKESPQAIAIMEAGKSHNMPSASWSPRKASGVSSSSKAGEDQCTS